MTKKTYKAIKELPTKEDGRVKAPDLEHVNDPGYVEYRVQRAAKRRPTHVK